MPAIPTSRRRCYNWRRFGGRWRGRPPKRSSSYRRGSSMWSRDNRAGLGLIIRLAAVIGTAALTAACFQPLYGDNTPAAGPPGSSLRLAMAAVDVDQIDAPKGSADARVAVELRNDVLFELTG